VCKGKVNNLHTKNEIDTEASVNKVHKERLQRQGIASEAGEKSARKAGRHVE